jgi:hypothetical protein
VIGFVGLLLGSVVLAQTSAGFTLDEHAFNAGGAPTELASTSFRVTLASIGEAVVARGLQSGSLRADLGFDAAYPPPGEVGNLRFADPELLVWDAEPSAGDYGLYAGPITDPFDLGFGVCLQPPPPLTAPSATIGFTPAPNEALFFLVTVRNRLGESGTKGFQSNGTERRGAVCP